MIKVKKRNGNLVPFDINKITSAIKKAFVSCNISEEDCPAAEIASKVVVTDGISVEDIQDQVESLLMAYPKVAKSYILYREKHRGARFIRERIDYMNKYSFSNENASSSSETDANANVSIKNVANLEGEVYKTTNRIIQRQRMKDKLNELFPEVANSYEEDLNNYIIYTHDEASTPTLKPYCMAVTLYPLMSEGSGNIDGVTPSPPNDIQSFSGQVTNLVFLLSSQCKGAVALGDYFVALNYYVLKEFGENWYNNLDKIVTTNRNPERTIKDSIRKGMKQFIYGVNQPAGNRSYNSPFTNISYYDRYYFKSLFNDFYYPDGTQPRWEAIDALQRIFMELHRELRLIKPLTFPVSTIALVHDKEGNYLDTEYKELCASEWAKGGSFFCYNSDNPSSLASCCFSKDTKVLWKSSTCGVKLTTLEELHNTKWEPYKKNLRIFHNGSWISGKSIKLPCREMYKVTTYNNKTFYMTDNHINVTLDGEKPTTALTTDDYLLFNTKALAAVPEDNEHLTFSQGFVIGAFLGDGSFGATKDNGIIYETIISQNLQKKDQTVKRFKSALKQMGLDNNVRVAEPINNKYNVIVSCKELVAFIQKWTNWERGTYSYNKKLNLNCLLQSVDFRRGILAGWYSTDGGNSNRCYTASKELAEDMEVLITSLGLNSIIDKSDRTDEKVIIRDAEYNRNYPLYCVRWYSESNHRQNKDVNHSWIFKNNSIYFRIKSIEKTQYNDYVYCIECRNQKEPYFTLPCGLITHNCRVLNEMSDNTFSSTTGMTGIMTGSCNVITLNINRIVQDWYNSDKPQEGVDYDIQGIMHDKKNRLHSMWVGGEATAYATLKGYLIHILNRVYKYHIAYKTMLYEMEEQGMYSCCNAGYIYLKKLYSTIGIIGYTEAAQYLGLTVGNNEEYKNFLRLILGTIKEQNKCNGIHDKKRPFLFNSEAIPGENLGVKFYQADKKDGYWVPEDQNLYNCYFYNPWNENTSILDKMVLHGKGISAYCDGGQAAHLNLDAHLSKEQYSKLLDFAAKEGTNYFTFNIPMSECSDCGHVVNAPITECPKCHSKKIKYWTRIIGYLVCVNSWSSERQKEFTHRKYVNGKEQV